MAAAPVVESVAEPVLESGISLSGHVTLLIEMRMCRYRIHSCLSVSPVPRV
jgi:hypothetical protein